MNCVNFGRIKAQMNDFHAITNLSNKRKLFLYILAIHIHRKIYTKIFSVKNL